MVEEIPIVLRDKLISHSAAIPLCVLLIFLQREWRLLGLSSAISTTKGT
jgi:hypothetical protein